MPQKRSDSTALPRSAKDTKKTNLDPGPPTKGTLAERDAKQHNAETGWPKPVDAEAVGRREAPKPRKPRKRKAK